MGRRLVGVDVGGTFTDFLLLDGDTLTAHKVLSTPDDPSRAVVQGLDALGVRNAVPVAHGSTVATNALLERRGAKTALITTQGFEDMLNIGRQARPSLYDLLQDKPEPLVPEELTFGVAERLDKDGRVILPLTPQDAERVVKQVEASGAEAVAVSLLFSFLSPLHEDYLASLLERLPSAPFLSLSSRVLPEFREFERTSTVTVNAYVGPGTYRYLGRLEDGVGKKGLRIMQSSGGSISAVQASDQPVRTILSGPAGGVVGAFWLAEMAGHPNVITLDMGGTSTDVSLCPERIQDTTGSVAGGLPVSVPMIDIHTVGAGGGSIARIDAGGALRVGPQSSGADPGPACYGKGTDPTVTDANLVLGRLVAQHFLGGRMSLDMARARKALEQIARELETDATGAALGVVRVVNSNMERAIRAVSLEKGFDPRQFTLLAFGGAGAMHACELAEELSIPRVMVPLYPGILSALGVAVADIVKDYARTVMLGPDALTAAAVDEAFAPLENQALDDLAREGYERERRQLNRMLDVRYRGQSYELTVASPDSGSGEFEQAVAEAFHSAHRQRFGHSDPTQRVEVVNVRLKAVVQGDRPAGLEHEPAMAGSPEPIFRSNMAFAAGECPQTPVYSRESLAPGARINGPAVVVQMDATTVLPPGWVASVDRWSNLIAERGHGGIARAYATESIEY